MKTMNLSVVLDELASSPTQFEAILKRFPGNQLNWMPDSWNGIPSEEFSLIGHLCHLRDIETDGFQGRFQRIIKENHPTLLSIDGYELAERNAYHLQVAEVVLSEFSNFRLQTIEMIKGFSEGDLRRTAILEGYGGNRQVTLLSLIYFLLTHDFQHLAGINWLLGKIAAEN